MEVVLEPLGHLHAFTRVTFLKVIVKAPSEACYAEEQVNKRTYGQEKITYNEVFHIKYIHAAKSYSRKYVESENTGKACYEYKDTVDNSRFFL